MDINNSFIELCKSGDLNKIKSLFLAKPEPDVNYLAAYGYRKACQFQHTEVITSLLEHHAVALTFQKLAFQTCCKNSCVESFKAIVAHSDIIKSLNVDELYTCLLLASMRESSEYIAEFLYNRALGVGYIEGRQKFNSCSELDFKSVLKSHQESRMLDKTLDPAAAHVKLFKV